MAHSHALAGGQDTGREGWDTQAPSQHLGLSLWARDEGQSLEGGILRGIEGGDRAQRGTHCSAWLKS